MSNLFTFVAHPRIEKRRAAGPPKVTDELPAAGRADRFNRWLALKITAGVGTMWCAYVFAAIALISLPAAISSHSVIEIVSWVAQTFLQLVLLSIIIVGQNVQSAAADHRAEATYEDADAVLHTALQIQAHLEAQDSVLETIIQHVRAHGAPAESAPEGPPAGLGGVPG